MNKKTGKQLLLLQNLVWQDSRFQELSREHTEKNRKFLETVRSLPAAQQENIWDYIGLLVELHYTFLSYALDNCAE